MKNYNQSFDELTKSDQEAQVELMRRLKDKEINLTTYLAELDNLRAIFKEELYYILKNE